LTAGGVTRAAEADKVEDPVDVPKSEGGTGARIFCRDDDVGIVRRCENAAGVVAAGWWLLDGPGGKRRGIGGSDDVEDDEEAAPATVGGTKRSCERCE
jgi:hypothetical protein